jgi:hypothetical protein
MYTESCEALKAEKDVCAQVKADFEAYKEEVAGRVYTITIDEKEYNVNELNDKYVAELAEKDASIAQLSADLEEQKNLCDGVKADLCNLQAQVEKAEQDKLCGDGIALADEEDDLDEDDKKCIKEKCQAHEYKSLQEVEDDIARALYQKKKNNRSKTFKTNVPRTQINDDAKSIFDKI